MSCHIMKPLSMAVLDALGPPEGDQGGAVLVVVFESSSYWVQVLESLG